LLRAGEVPLVLGPVTGLGRSCRRLWIGPSGGSALNAEGPARAPALRGIDPVLLRVAALVRPWRWTIAAGIGALIVATALQLAVAPLAQRLTNDIRAHAHTGHTAVILNTAGM